MTDQTDNLRDDIAFLRGLAESGREGVMQGGSVALVSGLLFGTASLAIWAGSQAGIDGGVLIWAWPISGVLFGLFMAGFLRRVRPQGAASRAAGIAWSGAGWAMFTVVASLLLMANKNDTWQIAAAISPMILAIYGCGWFIAGRVYRSLWISLVAFGSWAMALVNAWFATDGAVGFLVYAITLYALAAVPGAVMIRQARRG
jgi:hypothetical protein